MYGGGGGVFPVCLAVFVFTSFRSLPKNVPNDKFNYSFGQQCNEHFLSLKLTQIYNSAISINIQLKIIFSHDFHELFMFF